MDAAVIKNKNFESEPEVWCLEFWDCKKKIEKFPYEIGYLTAGVYKICRIQKISIEVNEKSIKNIIASPAYFHCWTERLHKFYVTLRYV